MSKVRFGDCAKIKINNLEWRAEYICYADYKKIDLYLWCDCEDADILNSLKSKEFEAFIKRDMFKGRIACLCVNGYDVQYDVYPTNLRKGTLTGDILLAIKSYVDYKDK